MPQMATTGQLSAIRRVRAGVRGETNIEVFFDLVYAFAVMQLTHYLVNHATIGGAQQTVLLLTGAGRCGLRGRDHDPGRHHRLVRPPSRTHASPMSFEAKISLNT